MNTLGIETSFGEWDIKAQASKIDTTFDTYMPIGYFIGGGQLTNLSYDISDPQNPIVNFDGTYRDVDYSTKLLVDAIGGLYTCLLYTSPSPRDQRGSRMPSSA